MKHSPWNLKILQEKSTWPINLQGGSLIDRSFRMVSYIQRRGQKFSRGTLNFSMPLPPPPPLIFFSRAVWRYPYRSYRYLPDKDPWITNDYCPLSRAFVINHCLVLRHLHLLLHGSHRVTVFPILGCDLHRN